MNFIQPLINAAKITFTGATVAAIAFGFGVFDQGIEVPESQADILSMDFADRTSTEKFVAGLQDLGHNAPEVYNLNGNTVFFSSAIHKEEPLVVMEKYEREFYEQGLNPEIFSGVTDENADRMFKTSLSGGVVPMVISPDSILLGGVESTGPTKTEEDLVNNFNNNKGKAPWKLFDAHKYVEINRDGENTLVTSSWSDKGFDYEKMIPGAKVADVNTDAEVPACPGCVRLTNFEDLGGEKAYRNNVFVGSADASQQVQFYDRALVGRGWEETESSVVMEKLRGLVEFQGQEAQMREYSRNGQFMQVIALPDSESNQTITHTVMSD